MSHDAPLLSRAWLTVLLLWVVGCLNYLDRVTITTMRLSVKEAIPMTEAQFGLLTTGFLVVYAVLSPFAGFLADRYRRSDVIIASLAVWSVVTWATARATTYEQLLLTRLLMGVSEACFLPAALALVADYHPGRTRSLATGLVLGGVMVGGALGGVGGWLAEHHGWAFAFEIFGGGGLAYALVLAALLRDPPAAAVTAAVAEPARPRLGATLGTLLSSPPFLLAFVYWGLLGVAGWMIIGWMPTFLQEQFHLAQGEAGLIATVYVNAASLIGLVIGGAWSDRWSRSNPAACLHVTAIGLVAAVPGILAVITTGSLSVAIVGLVCYGLTIAFASGEMMPILCLFLDRRHLATGFGVLNLFACVVGGATTYAGGALRDAHLNVTWLFLAGVLGLVVCAGLLLLMRPRPAAVPKCAQPLESSA
ncbi:MAG: MFS transporter [Verrucomicrobia bacterium]|nr:MFS transporter [Verrucomicrobiota bacterium]